LTTAVIKRMSGSTYFAEKMDKCPAVEKMDKCQAVELGVPRYPLKKKRKKKKMIAHGPSNKQYASKS